MLNDYLQFAKTQVKESTSTINLSNLFIENKRELKNDNLIIVNSQETIFSGRATSLKRCFQILLIMD